MKLHQYIAVFFVIIIIFVNLTGCLEEKRNTEKEEPIVPEIRLDQPSILPDWKDGEYHDYYATIDLLYEFHIKYPDLVNVFSIGKSVLGKDIWCIRLTNEKNTKSKASYLIDGCTHGNEWESGEACLYLAEYLLINSENNQTIYNILNTSEIFLIPLVNPDGREADDRYTDNGVDPNRNFNVFFGRLIRGRCFRLGKLFGSIKIPIIKLSRNDPSKWFRNCGRYPFSEPEVYALSSFIKKLSNKDLSFYVNCHTPLHNVIAPWISYKPPFEKTNQEEKVYNHVLNWVEKNTEYDGDKGEEFKAKCGGTAMDWCFKEFRIPSFRFEILTTDYAPYPGSDRHEHLVYWMKTSIPFFMYLLVNIDNLSQWKIPDVLPSLPEGIPPEPLL